MLFVTGSFRCGRSRYPNGALCRLVAPYQDKLAPYRVSEMAPVEDSFKDVFFFFEKPTRAKLSKVRGYAVPKNNARVMAIQMWAVVQWSGHVTCIFDKCHISSKHAVRGYVSKAELTWDLDVENGYFVSVETRWPRSSSGEYKVKQQMKSMIYAAGFPLMPMETRGIFTFLKPVFMLALCWNVFAQRQMSISGAINPALYIW